jgi:hypothetical protein
MDITQDITYYDTIIIERNNHQIIGPQLPLDPDTMKIRGKEQGGGADFRHVYSGEIDDVREYLKRLEIGADNKRYSCFIYALRIAGFGEDLCNRANVRCFTRYLRLKDVINICTEFDIDIELKIYGWDAYDLSKSRTVIKPKSRGAPRITLWRGHYFIHESTPFTDQTFGANLRKDSTAPLPLSSTRLLMVLFQQNLMRLMTVDEMPHEIEEIIFEGLDYNTKMCVDSSGPENKPKITYQQVVENPKLNPRYGWQDFEPLLKFVPKLGGIPKAFITRAVIGHAGRSLAVPGIRKNVSLLDINSLYPAALAELRIPISKPSVWNCLVNLSKVVDYISDIGRMIYELKLVGCGIG